MKRIALIIGILSLVSCNRNEKRQDDIEVKTPVVSVRTIASERIDIRLKLSGDVVASNSVDIYPDVAGKISSIDVSEGDYVVKDSIVATVDRNKPGMNFAPSPVLSPISGTITQVYTNNGSIAAPAMPLFKIGTLDRLEIETNISEKDLSRVTLGQFARVTTDAYPEKEYKAVVSSLNPVVNPITRTLGIKLDLVNSTDLKPGMFIDLELITQERNNTIVVTRDEIVSRNGIYYLWKYDNSRVQLKKVETGIEKDNFLEIISGIEIGDEIVTQGFTYLEDGIEVRTLDKEAK